MNDKELKIYKEAVNAIAKCASERATVLLLAPKHHTWGFDDGTELEGELSGDLPAIPEALFTLHHLEVLVIWHSAITFLPEELLRLSKLRQLSVQDASLKKVPPWLQEMTSLRTLSLRGNPLEIERENFRLPPRLEKLYLGECGLSVVPSSIWCQRSLRRISLEDGRVREISSGIGEFTKLEYLNLRNCELSNLPIELLKLAELGTLKELYLHGNPDLEIPEAILGPDPYEIFAEDAAPTCPVDILTAYFDKQKAKESNRARPFREARVVLVGDGLAGKTSLANWLVSGKKADTKKRRQTLGVDILDWKIPDIPQRGELDVRVWDFGGQELMHETHQKLFLGEEAVYILVVNRGGDDPVTKIRYWMKLIRAQAPKARVLVSLNHCDDGACALSERDLPAECRENFPNKALFPTSCKTAHGLPALKKALLRELSNLREPWLPWAPEYFAVKEKMAALKKEGRPHVNLEFYAQVCVDAGLKEDGGRNALLACLDHAGLLVRIPRVEDDDRALLEPEWLTGGLYRLLNHKELANAKGLLHKADLARWLDQRRYTEADRSWLLRVMVAHELAFESDGTWFVPPLLNQSPDDGATAVLARLASAKDGLRLICRYKETLPVGVIGRLIAKTHDLSPKHLWWRDGIVLEESAPMGCLASVHARWDEVRGGQGVISFTVAGSGSRPVKLLAVLRRHLEEIHRSFRELIIEWQVPHPDFPDALPIPLAELEDAEFKGLTKYPRHMGEYGFQDIVVPQLLGPLASSAPTRSLLKTALFAEVDDTAPPKPPYAFLSYMGEDVAAIQDLRDALRSEGITVWWDKLHIPSGSAWRIKLRDAVMRGNALVSCWSKNVDVRARTVAKFEVETAVPKHQDMLNDHSFIFPVRLEKCEIPLIAVGNDRLEDLQIRDLFGQQREEALKLLVADLRKAMEV